MRIVKTNSGEGLRVGCTTEGRRPREEPKRPTLRGLGVRHPEGWKWCCIGTWEVWHG